MRGLGARHREAHHLARRDELLDELSPPDLELVRGAEVRPARHLPLDRLDDGRIAVPEEQGAMAHPVVDVLVAVHVPLAHAGRAVDVDGERREMADVVRDPAGDHFARAIVQRGGLRMQRPVSLQDRHRCPPRAFMSSTIPAWAAKGTPSTVASRRRVMPSTAPARTQRSEEHTSELQSPCNLVCRLLLEKKKKKITYHAKKKNKKNKHQTR